MTMALPLAIGKAVRSALFTLALSTVIAAGLAACGSDSGTEGRHEIRDRGVELTLEVPQDWNSLSLNPLQVPEGMKELFFIGNQSEIDPDQYVVTVNVLRSDANMYPRYSSSEEVREYLNIYVDSFLSRSRNATSENITFGDYDATKIVLHTPSYVNNHVAFLEGEKLWEFNCRYYPKIDDGSNKDACDLIIESVR